MLRDENVLSFFESFSHSVLGRELDVYATKTNIVLEVDAAQRGWRHAEAVVALQQGNALAETHGLHVAQLPRPHKPLLDLGRELAPGAAFSRISSC